MNMDIETLAIIVLVIVAAIAIGMAVYFKNKYRRPTDYKALFIVGAAFVAIGAANNNTLIPAGIIFMLLGLKNRSKWEENRFRWSQLSKEEKNAKIIFLSILLLTLIGAGSILFINQA